MKSRLGVALATMLAGPGLAHANVHVMNIVEIFPGTELQPGAQYVVLQMHDPFQNVTSGTKLDIYDRTGARTGGGTFASNVPQTADQTKILLATPSAATLFNVTPNFTITEGIVPSGGRVCFVSPNLFGTIDCAAWGDDPGSPVSLAGTSVGPPFRRGDGGLQTGVAMVRRLDIVGSSGTLDDGEDTGSSRNDFISGMPAPRNSSGVTGTLPPSTCGNELLEGLEQCDDGGTTPGDGCDALCLFDDLVFLEDYEGF